MFIASQFIIAKTWKQPIWITQLQFQLFSSKNEIHAYDKHHHQRNKLDIKEFYLILNVKSHKTNLYFVIFYNYGKSNDRQEVLEALT